MPHRTIACLTTCLCLVALAAADPARAAPPLTRIRPTSARVAALLAEGSRLSPTMAWLVTALERSDVIVHVEDRVRRDRRIIGETRFVVCAGGQRYVRISVDLLVRGHAAIALLGHELQHAWEIAARSWVIDQTTLERLYREIGRSVDGGSGTRRFDTPAGPDTERRVRAELRAYGAPPNGSNWPGGRVNDPPRPGVVSIRRR